MKKKLNIVLGGICLLAALPLSAQASTAFTVSATLPTANTVSIAVDSVNVASGVFTPVTGTSLSFDPLSFNSTNNIWVPAIYYALNVAATGGGGLPDTTVTYAEGSNPNGTTNGLGYKTVATFDQELGTKETLLPQGNQRLIDLTGTVGHVPYTELASGSYLRVYLGIWTGSPSNPSNGQPFTNGDAPGKYTGTVTVTATVD